MKIDRLLGIIITLLQQEKVTAHYLAEKFEVSVRTINRDIVDLCKAGIPVVTTQGANGGISVLNGYKIDKTLLTKSELKLILAGLSTLGSISTDNKYKLIMDKFVASNDDILNSNHIIIDLSSYYKSSLSPKIQILQSSIDNCTAVSFNYYSSKGEKLVLLNPYLIIFQWNSWYVLGCENSTNKFKLYKLNRLWNLEATAKAYKFEEIPKEALDFNSFYTHNINAVILFDECVKYRLIEEYGLDFFTYDDDGRLRFTFDFTNEDYLITWVLSYGSNADLVEPKSLRKKIKIILKETLNKYN